MPAISIAKSLKIERCAYARIEELRIELLNALVHADESVRRAVAEVCGRVPSGNPFEDLGRALAAARGLDGDAEFLMRAGMLTLALLEVLDPDAVDSLDVAMHTPGRECAMDGNQARSDQLDGVGAPMSSHTRRTESSRLLTVNR